ncbi:sialidase family protein [Pseudomonas segetis]|uniref:exo-alpha-sialidase n=1 Tax=Pseudomonas segetis TaxID=298908 RepID=A0A239C722_9PSED|nr:sialidase family protein [Pseudomonas segetis]SNS15692.1 BNR repeat-like domain-containing protein [Pseudomonas segetis]
MTVQTTTNVATGIGNGVTTVFPVGYKFNQDADLVVFLIETATSIATLQILNSDYSVQGAGDDDGGSITFLAAAPASGYSVKVTRLVDLLQLTDLRNQGKFFAEVHEDVFDLLVMMIQQVAQATDSSLHLNEAGNQWDAKGHRIVNVGDPVNDQDAATKLWTQQYIAQLLEAGQGPVNNAENVIYIGPDMVAHVVQDLSGPDGAEFIGRGAETVEDALVDLEDRADDIELKLAIPNGNLIGIARENRVNTLARFDTFPQRVVGKALYRAIYDHFGQMDLLPTGEIYLIFRTATDHTGGTDGRLAFSKIGQDGTWNEPTIIATAAGGDDFRDAAGGTMPSGRIICAGTVYETGDLHVFASDDYGATWSLKQTILKGATDYRFAHGKGFQIGNKFVIPYYTATGAVYQLRWLESTNGGDTWTEGATVYSGAIAYNETAYLDLGGAAVLAVARIGSGAGGKLRQFVSLNGGTTWTDQGDVTAQNGDSTDVVVSPSLSYVYSEGGTPHVVLFYTNRTQHFCYYRTIPVSKAAAGAAGWSDRTSVYSAPSDSGYQSQVVLGGRRILGTVFRELSASASGAFQFEANMGSLPDYESDWTAVVASTLYTFAHGLQHPPRRVEVEYASSSNPTTWTKVYASFFNDGANKGSGAQVEIGATNIRVGTGAAVWGTAYFGGFDATTGARVTSGFYRVRAWI